MDSNIGISQPVVRCREVHSLSVQPRGPLTECYLMSLADVLQAQSVLSSLCAHVWKDGLNWWRRLMPLKEHLEAQLCVEGLHRLCPLFAASPLPSGVDSLGIQNMVRCQEEPMGRGT